jgi:hypothetical protein
VFQKNAFSERRAASHADNVIEMLRLKVNRQGNEPESGKGTDKIFDRDL